MNKLRPEVTSLLHANETDKLRELLEQQDFHRLASLINHTDQNKVELFSILSPRKQSQVAIALSPHTKRYLFPRLSDTTLSRFLQLNDDTDITDILQFVPRERRTAIVEKLQEQKRKKIEKLLKYKPETAGRLMDFNFILVKPDFTMADVANKVQSFAEKENQTPLVITANEEGKVIGYIPYKSLILAKPKSKISDLSQALPVISYTTDQERVLTGMIMRRDEVAGVVDEKNRILGILFAKDLIQIVQSEAAEDFFGLAGVSREEDALDSVGLAVRNRYKWLIINLATAFLAAFVVSLFEDTISQMAILAAYMPVVAGMGGNAGTQALAVVVRGIALGSVTWKNGKRIILKEGVAGAVNGIITGIITAIWATLVNANPLLGLVLGIAMVGNLIVAGVFGALVPLMLKKFNIDPAVASSIFVTTATDVLGFFFFLGLATIVLI